MNTTMGNFIILFGHSPLKLAILVQPRSRNTERGDTLSAAVITLINIYTLHNNTEPFDKGLNNPLAKDIGIGLFTKFIPNTLNGLRIDVNPSGAQLPDQSKNIGQMRV